VTSTSIWTQYEKGVRNFCGHPLPDGMRKHQKLEKPIITPSTKAPEGQHDISASREELLAMGACDAKTFDEMAAMATTLFRMGQEHCAKNGVILVDTKYEFGRDPSGRIVVVDEIHTPDSSRFWIAGSYDAAFAAGKDPEAFDKEYVRRWLKAQGYSGDGPSPPLPDDVRVEASARYADAVERITGEPFAADLEAPAERLRRNLAPWMRG
jgi:phosphoribosylaminoimidazole-succinocarboxamide synthase